MEEQQITKNDQDQQELQKLNQQMKTRSQKFGSQFTPLTIEDYKLFKIKKASQTGNIKFLQGLLLNDIQDLQQRKKKIQTRTKKFFQSIDVQSDPNKFFNQKTVPDFSQDALTLRENAWYLFGVDYMSNQRIRHYFQSNPHFKIQWINDSSCNIVFNSPQQAAQAIKPYRKGGQMKNDEQQIWYELNQYEVEGVKRKLFCRMATNKDLKKESQHGQNSQYYKWIKNKQKMDNFVKKTARNQIYKAKRQKFNKANEKTKAINKNNNGRVKKRQQSQDQNSSSGVDSSVDENQHQKRNFKQQQIQEKDNADNQEENQ